MLCTYEGSAATAEVGSASWSAVTPTVQSSPEGAWTTEHCQHAVQKHQQRAGHLKVLKVGRVSLFCLLQKLLDIAGHSFEVFF